MIHIPLPTVRLSLPAALSAPWMRRLRALAPLGAMIAALPACSSVPVAGPLAPQIHAEATDVAPPFILIPVNRMTLTALAHATPDNLTLLATPAPSPEVTIHIGDMISITLWEFGSGLLGPVATATAAQPGLVGAQSATVPNQTVDQTGNVIVPFAGEIHAAGKTTHQVQAAIIAALRGKANQTQALVQIVQTTDNAVTVTGDVNHPGRFALVTSGTHLLDVISLAGGSTGKARDTAVQLSRGGIATKVRMADILADPAQNIYMRPGDVVTLEQEPQTLVVLGAMTKNQEVPFGKSRVTLAEAIGNGGGLSDQLADPFGIYVMRYEKLTVARSLRTDPLPDYLATGEMVPVVYQINFKTADGMLLAQNFVMRDRDVVYVADAPTVQVGKILRLLDIVTSVFKSGSIHSYSY